MGRRRHRCARGPRCRPSTGFRQAGGAFTRHRLRRHRAGRCPGRRRHGATIAQTLIGAFAGLIVVIVVAAMFMTAEYRRGLIRITLAASPRRGRVLAAKAVVIGAVTFVAGLVGVGRRGRARPAAAARQRHLRLPGHGAHRGAGDRRAPRPCSRSPPSSRWPSGTMLRRSAGGGHRRHRGDRPAVPARRGRAGAAAAGPTDWLLRLTPAAAFAVQQTPAAVPPGHQHLHAGRRATSRWRRGPGFAVLCRLDRGRALAPGRLACCAGGTHERLSAPAVHGASGPRLRTLRRHRCWLLARRRRG